MLEFNKKSRNIEPKSGGKKVEEVNLKFGKSYQEYDKSNNNQGSKNKLETFTKNT